MDLLLFHTFREYPPVTRVLIPTVVVVSYLGAHGHIDISWMVDDWNDIFFQGHYWVVATSALVWRHFMRSFRWEMFITIMFFMSCFSNLEKSFQGIRRKALFPARGPKNPKYLSDSEKEEWLKQQNIDGLQPDIGVHAFIWFLILVYLVVFFSSGIIFHNVASVGDMFGLAMAYIFQVRETETHFRILNLILIRGPYVPWFTAMYRVLPAVRIFLREGSVRDLIVRIGFYLLPSMCGHLVYSFYVLRGLVMRDAEVQLIEHANRFKRLRKIAGAYPVPEKYSCLFYPPWLLLWDFIRWLKSEPRETNEVVAQCDKNGVAQSIPVIDVCTAAFRLRGYDIREL